MKVDYNMLKNKIINELYIQESITSAILDRITYNIRTDLNLHGVSMALLNDDKKELKVVSISTLLPANLIPTIKLVKFNFKLNKIADNYFKKLNQPDKIMLKDLIQLITNKYKINVPSDIINNLIQNLMKTQLGEILLIPLFFDKIKSGAVLYASKANNKFIYSEIDILSRLNNLLGSNLKNKKIDA